MMQNINKFTKLKHINIKSIDLIKKLTNSQKHFTTQKENPESENNAQKIIGACIVARAPLVKAIPPIWEQEYKAWQKKMRERKEKAIPESWDDKKEKVIAFEEAQDEETKRQRTWKPNPIITNSSESDKDKKSLMRMMDQYVYLMLKKKNDEWEFPCVENIEGETIRSTGERALKNYVEGTMKVFFIANWPFVHYVKNDKSMVFFMKSQILNGYPDLIKNDVYLDHAWIAKSELHDYIKDEKWLERMKLALI